jgi:hypothetical protein
LRCGFLHQGLLHLSIRLSLLLGHSAYCGLSLRVGRCRCPSLLFQLCLLA